MNELIKIEKENLGNKEINTVNARDLWMFLESKQQFGDWIKNRIDQYNFIQDVDFICFHKTMKAENSNEANKTFKEYHISLDMAKELSMVERNAKGKEARQYFIECEQKLKSFEVPKTFSDALKLAWEQSVVIEAQKLQLTQAQPKVDFYDAVTSSKDAKEMSAVAKVLDLGVGRNTIFKILRDKKVLRHNNEPYQEYIDRGYFRVIEQKYTMPDGEVRISLKTVVYQKGLEYIKQLVLNDMDLPESKKQE